jgi:hypothetical protein
MRKGRRVKERTEPAASETPKGIANHKVQLAVMPRASANGGRLLSGEQSGIIGACFWAKD